MKTRKFGEILALLGIKYVIVTTDALIAPGQRYSFNLSLCQGFLSRQENIHLVRAFGPHLLYENVREVKTFYTFSLVVKSNLSSNDASSSLLELTEFEDPFKVAISSDIALSTKFPPPEMTVKKISPAAYKIDVMNASSGYLLVAPFIYDENWIAVVGSIELRPIKVNGLVSGWLMEKPGYYSVSIRYIAQDYAEKGYAISITMISISTIVVVAPSIITRKARGAILRIRNHVRQSAQEKRWLHEN